MRKMITLPQDVWQEVLDYQESVNFDTVSDAVYSLVRYALDEMEESLEEEVGEGEEGEEGLEEEGEEDEED
jgi:hypothetical protein